MSEATKVFVTKIIPEPHVIAVKWELNDEAQDGLNFIWACDLKDFYHDTDWGTVVHDTYDSREYYGHLQTVEITSFDQVLNDQELLKAIIEDYLIKIYGTSQNSGK